jgi:uncharacterized protein YggE
MKEVSAMKTIRILVILVVVLALTACQPLTVTVQEQARQRTITVTGEAEVRVVPDEVILTLGVETSNSDMETAKAQNDVVVRRLLSMANEAGIESKYVQTDYIGIEPRYRDSYDRKDFLGYFVRKNVVITLKDITKFEALLSRSLELGANYVHAVEFRTTELRKHRDEARALAIKAAQEKATALASELGQSIGRPITITENQSNWWSGYGSWWGYSWGGSASQNVVQNAAGSGVTLNDGTLAPGQIAVNASVTVEFELK